MTRDALEIIDRRHKGDPEWEAMLVEEELKARVAQVVYALREETGVTQAEFARIVGIHRTDVSKLENADYEGSTLEMLWRICKALHKPWEISYPCPGRKSRCRVAIPGRRRAKAA